MNRRPSVVAIVLLLCSCTQTASTEHAASTAADSPFANTAASEPATGAPAGTQTEAPQTVASNQPASAPEGRRSVNQAIDDALGDHTRYEAVIDAFQTAVAKGDKDGVAALVSYPIDVTIDGKPATIKDGKAFVAEYDRFMTPEIVGVVKTQKYQDLFVNDRGVMFGDGQVWINGICKDEACKEPDVKVVALQPGSE